MAAAADAARWLAQATDEVRTQHHPALLLDRDHRILGCSGEFLKRFSLEVEPRGRFCWEVTHGRDRPCDLESQLCPLLHAFSSRMPWRELHTHPTSHGPARQEVLCVPVLDDDGRVGAVVQYLFDLDEMRARDDDDGDSDYLIGTSPVLRRAFELARRVAPRMTTVLLIGEPGTEKVRLAQAIHRMSGRTSEPCVVIDCGRVSGERFEAEILRHAMLCSCSTAHDLPGAGSFLLGGTLVLARLDLASSELQPRLLHLLATDQSGAQPRVRVAARVIGTARPRLASLVQTGAFPADLYYRLGVFPITIPPLRERPEDLDPLIEQLLSEIDPLGLASLSSRAWARLRAYDFPGNVGELRAILERAYVLAEDKAINACHIVLQDERSRS